MDVTLEYILAVLAIFIMLSTSIFAVTSMTTTQLSLVGEQQLQPVAQQLMDKFLLTAGSPSNWGYLLTNGSNLVDFGLASASAGSPPYSIDPAKLIRLNNLTSSINNTMLIDPTVVGSLTGLYLSGTWSYGFKLTVIPSLNVTIYPPVTATVSNTLYPKAFNLSLTTSNGLAVPGATLTAYLYGLLVNASTGSFSYNSSVAVSATTNWAGNATLNFSSPPVVTNGYSNTAVFILLVRANSFGLASNGVAEYYSKSGSLTLYNPTQVGYTTLLLGQYVVANMQYSFAWENASSPAVVNLPVIEITDNFNLALNPSSNVTASSLPVISEAPQQVYSLANPVGSNVVVAGFLVNDTSKLSSSFNSTVFVMTEQPTLPVSVSYTSLSAAKLQLLSAITIERLALVGRETYSVYLTVWRMSS